MIAEKRVLYGSLALSVLLGCAAFPDGGSGGTPPPLVTETRGAGVVVVDGTPRDYALDPARSQLALLVTRRSGQACSFFHNHAVGARALNLSFRLNPADLAGSTFRAEVAAAGLSPDEPAFRGAFAETQDGSFTEAEREDIRANVLDQVDGAGHPVLTFAARALSTLEGQGTATLDATVRGITSTVPLDASAVWEGTTLILRGTGTLRGADHGIPVGSFRQCINPDMALKFELVLVPGETTANATDAAVPAYVPQFFPDAQPCAPSPTPSFADVKDVLSLNCTACHDQEPAFGATVPLVRWEDFHTDTPLSAGVPLFTDLAERLNALDGRRMPPAPSAMSAPEKGLLLQWLNAGAPQYACDANGQPVMPSTAPPESTCHSGVSYTYPTGGNFPTSFAMFPDADCVSCHRLNQVLPRVVLAGTVFSGIRERDNCFAQATDPAAPSASLVVEVEDSAGQAWELPVFNSGNFVLSTHSDKMLTPPFRVAVFNKATGARRRMMNEVSEGSCNRCHTERGTLPADVAWEAGPPPGRVVAPEGVAP